MEEASYGISAITQFTYMSIIYICHRYERFSISVPCCTYSHAIYRHNQQLSI